MNIATPVDAVTASPFGWHRVGYVSTPHLSELDTAPHAVICCISQQRIPGPIEQIAVFVPISPFASRADGPIAEIKRRLASLISDDIYSPGYQRALDLVKTIEANSAADAHTRAIYDDAAQQVENLDVDEKEVRYVKGNVAYELDQLARRLRRAPAPAPAPKTTNTIDTDAERARFIGFYLTQSPLTREQLTFDARGFHHPTAQSAWLGWLGAKCAPDDCAAAPEFCVPGASLTYDDCYRFGIDINAVRMAANMSNSKPQGKNNGC